MGFDMTHLLQTNTAHMVRVTVYIYMSVYPRLHLDIFIFKRYVYMYKLPMINNIHLLIILEFRFVWVAHFIFRGGWVGGGGYINLPNILAF